VPAESLFPHHYFVHHIWWREEPDKNRTSWQIAFHYYIRALIRSLSAAAIGNMVSTEQNGTEVPVMADPAHVDDLMNKMRDAGQPPTHQPLHAPETELQPYVCHGAVPGENYYLVGSSYNLESPIVNPDLEAKRAGCISMMLETRGQKAHCVPIAEAFDYPGFPEVLSRFERDWLGRVPPNTMIGPAYDPEGQRIPTAFAVWKESTKDRMTSPVMVRRR
jgi:hypothetical protein